MAEIDEKKSPTHRTWHARAVFLSGLTLDQMIRFSDLKTEISAHRKAGGKRPVQPLEVWVMDLAYEGAKCHFPDLEIREMELTPVEEK
jgi:hypothetical protein